MASSADLLDDHVRWKSVSSNCASATNRNHTAPKLLPDG